MQLPRRDLDEAASKLAAEWDQIRNARILVTGATGFVGRWIVETFSHANALYRLDGHLVAVSRHPESFLEREPHLGQDPRVAWIRGDLETERTGIEAPGECYDLVIHAAGPSSRDLSSGGPERIFRAVAGTRRALDLAVHAGVQRFLFLSSGAIYERRPETPAHVSEDFRGTVQRSDPAFAYAETKIEGERLCLRYAQEHGICTTIARGFSFLGPLLPVGDKFAAGSFLGDVLRGAAIRVRSDGTPLRSYLHAGDMSVWLWTILMRGTSGRVYNVGSEHAVSIAELAQAAASLVDPPLPVRIEGSPGPSTQPESYVPSTERARSELGLAETVDWRESLRRTYEWHRTQQVPESTTRTVR